MSPEVERAMTAMQSGQLEEARLILASYLKVNTRDDQAWTLLALTLDNPERRRACLWQALTLNPENEDARQLLDDLSSDEEPPVVSGYQLPPLAKKAPEEGGSAAIEEQALPGSTGQVGEPPSGAEASQETVSGEQDDRAAQGASSAQLKADEPASPPGHNGSGEMSSPANYMDLPWESPTQAEAASALEKPPFEFGDLSFLSEEGDATGEAPGEEPEASPPPQDDLFPDWMKTAYDPEPPGSSTDWMFPEDEEEEDLPQPEQTLPEPGFMGGAHVQHDWASPQDEQLDEEDIPDQGRFTDTPYWIFPEDEEPEGLAPVPVMTVIEEVTIREARRRRWLARLVLHDGGRAGLVGVLLSLPLPLYMLSISPSFEAAFLTSLAGVFLGPPLWLGVGALAAFLIHRRGFAKAGQAPAAGAVAGLLVGLVHGFLMYALVRKNPEAAIMDLSLLPILNFIVYALLPVLLGTLFGSASATLTRFALRTPQRRPRPLQAAPSPGEN